MKYYNPIILQDFSDPDVIRVKNKYYMVASSFNHTPGIPVLESINLVNWKIIGYVFEELPFERFKDVCHGDGAWAPSIRYHNNEFYVSIPFPDEGIYISKCSDIKKGDWTKPWCLIEGKGFEDPCPIWKDDKCYMVLAFAKSRAGFNSVLGLYEVTPDLKKVVKGYDIIFDGHNTQPTIEGPKLHYINDYFYIMAPAGSVKTGWQTCLRSKNIYGPYEEKIVMAQNDSPINGPHQGALIDLPNNKWAFIHFQDMDVYGRICHLQPVKWYNDWPLCGSVKDELLCGSPVLSHEYLIDKKSNYKINLSDDFKKDKLSLIWQTPANKQSNWYYLDGKLNLLCYFHNDEAYKALNKTPNLFLSKIGAYSFTVKALCNLDKLTEEDETGLCFMGMKYHYICIKKQEGKLHLQVKQGFFNQENDCVLEDYIYENDKIEFVMKYTYPNTYQLGFNDVLFKTKFEATKGRWIGGKIGIYAKGLNNSGYASFEYFKVRGRKNDKRK